MLFQENLLTPISKKGHHPKPFHSIPLYWALTLEVGLYFSDSHQKKADNSFDVAFTEITFQQKVKLDIKTVSELLDIGSLLLGVMIK